MAKYELVLVLESDSLEKEEVKTLLAKIKQRLKEAKAKIIKEDKWGEKKLAYPIKGKREGLFIFMELELEKGITNLEKKFNLEEKILRYLFVKKNL